MKILSYIVSFIVGAIILLPPVDINYLIALSPQVWICCILAVALLAGYLFFLDINPFLKALVVILFLGCFYSLVPFISFTAYISFAAALYFFLFCKKYLDYNIFIRVLEVVFWLQIILLTMQAAHKDTLLNFVGVSGFYGTIFNSMRVATVFAVMAPFLILKNKKYLIPLAGVAFLSFSMGFIIALASGTLAYLFLRFPRHRRMVCLLAVLFLELILWANFIKTKDIFCLHVRGLTWLQTFKDGLQYPFTGWGMGTYKIIFHTVHGNNFWQAHNDWLQMVYEVGYIAIIPILAYVIYLLKITKKNPLLSSGLIVLGVIMFFHFPMRMFQTPLVMIAWLAYCEKVGGANGNR